MTNHYKTFKALHNSKELFLLPNAWDAESASVLQKNNFPAIGTSSAAVATSLGYADGEEMPFADYLRIIRRMATTITVPLTIDLEMGYGDTPEKIYNNIQQLLEVGVVGINVEDSGIANGKRYLKDANEFAATLLAVKNKLASAAANLFINVRCDTFLLDVPGKQNETIQRLKQYQEAGADGIFLPFIKDEADIARAVGHTRLPLNVMAIAGLPDTDTLNRLGVKRLSMGPFLFAKTYRALGDFAAEINRSKSITSII